MRFEFTTKFERNEDYREAQVKVLDYIKKNTCTMLTAHVNSEVEEKMEQFDTALFVLGQLTLQAQIAYENQVSNKDEALNEKYTQRRIELGNMIDVLKIEIKNRYRQELVK